MSNKTNHLRPAQGGKFHEPVKPFGSITITAPDWSARGFDRMGNADKRENERRAAIGEVASLKEDIARLKADVVHLKAVKEHITKKLRVQHSSRVQWREAIVGPYLVRWDSPHNGFVIADGERKMLYRNPLEGFTKVWAHAMEWDSIEDAVHVALGLPFSEKPAPSEITEEDFYAQNPICAESARKAKIEGEIIIGDIVDDTSGKGRGRGIVTLTRRGHPNFVKVKFDNLNEVDCDRRHLTKRVAPKVDEVPWEQILDRNKAPRKTPVPDPFKPGTRVIYGGIKCFIAADTATSQYKPFDTHVYILMRTEEPTRVLRANVFEVTHDIKPEPFTPVDPGGPFAWGVQVTYKEFDTPRCGLIVRQPSPTSNNMRWVYPTHTNDGKAVLLDVNDLRLASPGKILVRDMSSSGLGRINGLVKEWPTDRRTVVHVTWPNGDTLVCARNYLCRVDGNGHDLNDDGNPR